MSTGFGFVQHLLLGLLQGLFVRENRKHYCLKSLDCQLPDSEDLAIGQNIEVSDNDLPDVVDAAHID